MQRSARHMASQTDVEQAYAVGRAAVKTALAGKNALMVSIERDLGKPYAWSLGEVPLKAVANREKNAAGVYQ